MEAKVKKTDEVLVSIDGKLTEEQAKELILKKLFDLINVELTRYLNTEKRTLTQSIENLWDKYAVSKTEMEAGRIETLNQLDVFLKDLGYLL